MASPTSHQNYTPRLVQHLIIILAFVYLVQLPIISSNRLLFLFVLNNFLHG